MISKKHPPTVEQKRVHSALRDLVPCAISGYGSKGYQLHHLWGASAKHNKVWIGQDAVLLLPWELHDINSDHPLHVTKNKSAFEETFGMPQYLCVERYEALWELIGGSQYMGVTAGDMPDNRVLNAIRSYHK